MRKCVDLSGVCACSRACVCDWPVSQQWFGLQIPTHRADLWERGEGKREEGWASEADSIWSCRAWLTEGRFRSGHQCHLGGQRAERPFKRGEVTSALEWPQKPSAAAAAAAARRGGAEETRSARMDGNTSKSEITKSYVRIGMNI